MKGLALVSFEKWRLALLILFLSFQSFVSTESHKVRISDGYNGRGRITEYINPNTGCKNVQRNLRGKILSLKVYEGCAMFYTHLGCTGSFIQVLASDPFQGNLTKWNFHTLISSVGPCSSECSAHVIGPSVPNPMAFVILFYENLCRGESAQVQVNGCTMIPPSFNSTQMSINALGACIELYETTDCSSFSQNRLELRSKNPHTCELAKWNHKRFQSISLCSYKCMRQKDLEPGTTIISTEVTTNVSMNDLIVLPEATTINETTMTTKGPAITSEYVAPCTATTNSENDVKFSNTTKKNPHQIAFKKISLEKSHTLPPHVYVPIVALGALLTIAFLVLCLFIIVFRVDRATGIA